MTQTADQDRFRLGDKFRGSMLGAALGDAIGELAFSYPHEADLRAQIERRKQLAYTDDTAMMIGLGQSILEVGEPDPAHLGDTFRRNYRQEPWRGYASGPPTIFSLVERSGMTYPQAASSLFGGQGSFGNGAAMRIAPVGLAFHLSPDLSEKARMSASVTHAHPVGADGAAVLARAVAQAVCLDPKEPFPHRAFSQELVADCRTRELRDKMTLVGELITDAMPPGQAVAYLGRGVAVQDSMPFAVYSFLRNTTSFEACLLCAVLHGGDRDTVGTMACAVSGAYLGASRIPESWLSKLENHRYIAGLAVGLVDLVVRSHTEDGQQGTGHPARS